VWIFQTFLLANCSISLIFLKIFSGDIPFHELSNDCAVLLKVVNGIRPSRPTEVSKTQGLDNDIWQLIETCWDHQPNTHPRAVEVVLFFLPRLTQPRAVQTWDKSFVSRLRANLLEHPPFTPHDRREEMALTRMGR